MKNILIFLMLGILFSCTNLNKQDKLLTLEGECSQAGNDVVPLIRPLNLVL